MRVERLKPCCQCALLESIHPSTKMEDERGQTHLKMIEQTGPRLCVLKFETNKTGNQRVITFKWENSRMDD